MLRSRLPPEQAPDADEHLLRHVFVVAEPVRLPAPTHDPTIADETREADDEHRVNVQLAVPARGAGRRAVGPTDLRTLPADRRHAARPSTSRTRSRSLAALDGPS